MGKSTLIKVIVKKAQDQKSFNVVVKVEITTNHNLQRIQEEIAYMLTWECIFWKIDIFVKQIE